MNFAILIISLVTLLARVGSFGLFLLAFYEKDLIRIVFWATILLCFELSDIKSKIK